MKVDEFRKLAKKKPKYRARITKACPDCYSEVTEIECNLFMCRYCANGFKSDEIITFHSKDEQLRGAQLKAIERKGRISCLLRQTKFNLLPAAYIVSDKLRGGPTAKFLFNEKKNYKESWHAVEMYCADIRSYKDAGWEVVQIKGPEFYKIDFMYQVNGEWIYEDFKGFQTQDSKAKIKLFEALYNVKVSITTKEDLR